MSDRRADRFDRLAIRYARIALGAAFLSAVTSRLGIWSDTNFTEFEHYTGEVNSFMPAFTIPFLARAATVCELVLGIALIVGVRLRWVALGAALLLVVFGTAMAISFGIRSPFDYSVFSASACAVLLAARARQGADAREPSAPANASATISGAVSGGRDERDLSRVP